MEHRRWLLPLHLTTSGSSRAFLKCAEQQIIYLRVSTHWRIDQSKVNVV